MQRKIQIKEIKFAKKKQRMSLAQITNNSAGTFFNAYL